MIFKRYLVLLIALLCINTVVHAENSEIKTLQNNINQVSKTLSNDEKVAQHLSQQVRELEDNVAEHAKKIYKIEKELAQTTIRKKRADQNRLQLVDDMKVQQIALREQLQALYSAGQQSHLKLLLKQEDPSDIGRTIKYFELLNANRVNKIQSIKKTQGKIVGLSDKIQEDIIRLESLYQSLKIEKLANARTLESRNRALKKANHNTAYRKKKLKTLKTRESRLEEQIAHIERKRLERVARKEKAREARKEAKRDKERRDERRELATQKKEANAFRRRAEVVRERKRVKEAKKTSKRKTALAKVEASNKAKIAKNKAKTAKNKAKVVGKNQTFSSAKFSRQRGKLPWPVRGHLLNKYGAKKNEKRRWHGLLIKAPSGTRVKVVASGKISFAGYFKGYGYLVIVRHNNGYNSIYGHNQAVFVRKGQRVNAGHVIASVGNTGGHAQNALFFKLQKGKRPVNPLRWLKK
ncbi:MAG: peptidoglycan DD-metalloendopeptidase family protein [Thiotrichaceae bacterium]|nr:peptidoglycan DD-metalloendopeptidase family protein [Thiotrichaceae bacterium]